jgi:hypothetical protein
MDPFTAADKISKSMMKWCYGNKESNKI